VLATVARIPTPERDRLAADVRAEWRARLADLLAVCDDPNERQRVRAARDALAR
jgi:hypothetical protein